MCGIDFGKKRKSVMEDELFDKIVADLAEHKDMVDKVQLYLDSEPLCDKKIPERIEKTKRAGIRKVNISTNAALLDEVRGTKIINAGLDEIYINFDSLRKDVFESIRRKLKFEVVYENIINFIQLRNKLNPKIVIRIQMILQDNNADEMDDCKAHWKTRLNASDQIIVQKAHDWASAVKIRQFGDEFAINNIPCIGPFGTFCIHVDGTVGLCSMDTDPYPNGTTGESIGSVASKSIQEVWTDAPVQKVRDTHIAGKRHEISLCDGCALWREDKHLIEEILKTH